MKKSAASILITLLSGCSIHYTDSQGIDNYLGFFLLSTEANQCITTNTAKSIGLNIDTTKESGGLNIGFKTTSKTYIQNNSYIEIETDDKNLAHKINTASNCNAGV